MTYPPVPAAAQRSYASQVAPSYAATGVTGATAGARARRRDRIRRAGVRAPSLPATSWSTRPGPLDLHGGRQPGHMDGGGRAGRRRRRRLGTAALGLAIMSLPVSLINVNVNSVAEFLYMILCTAEFTKTINTLGCYIQIAGITTGTGVNGLAIYSEAGSKLGVTGDMTTQFETLGNAEGTLGSGVAITAGTNYYLCFLHNFTGTVPRPVGYTALTLTTGDPLVGTHYPALTYGSQASFPTSVTPSSGTGTANHFWIYGR